MATIPLKDANGDVIPCGALDVAGDPATLTDPVVVLQADGTFALAAQPELAALPPVAYGATNYSYPYGPTQYDTTTSAEVFNSPSGFEINNGVLTSLPDNRIYGLNDSFAGSNDFVSAGTHLTMVKSPIPAGMDATDTRYVTNYFESGTPLELQVFSSVRVVTTDEAIPTTFEVGFTLKLLEFDSIIANPTTDTWDTTGATITDLGTASTYMWKTDDAVDLLGAHFEALYHPDFARGLAEEGAGGYEKTIGTYIPLSISGDKNWVLIMGDHTIDGAPWNPNDDPSYSGITMRLNLFEV